MFLLTGLGLILGSILWAMIDFWPGEPIRFSPELLAEPVVNLVFGLSIAVLGAIVFGAGFQRLLVRATTRARGRGGRRGR